ncbi:TPA: AraC family ligand binding domain-containing protein, partial [Clostridium perfringens]|nr:AraC family ligand binding domain-containing protein [Clostridium perfringens]
MSNYIYENHFHRDPNFPVIFHCDILNKNRPSFLMHYHENIELLYFLDGHAKVVCDNKILQAKADDIIIINSKELHSIEKISDSCKYYCLIIDKDLLNDNLNNFDNFKFKNLVKD